MNRLVRSMKQLLVVVSLGISASAMAGPVIIAGTDADDHGYFDGTSNVTGWLFMQKAFDNIGAAVTNGNKRVVCIGCDSWALNAFNSAGALSTLAGSWSFTSLTSAADIAGFFDGTGAINVGNTGILYMPTVDSNVSGGITDAQLAIVNSNANALNNFVLGGGGLFTQEQANSPVGYGWLNILLPGLVVQGDNGGPGYNSSELTLTAAGSAAFPGLTSGDVDNATPWHAWFSGDFGGLSALATGTIYGDTEFQGAVILGGGGGTVIGCGGRGQPACDVPEPASTPLLGLGLAGMVFALRRRFAARKQASRLTSA